MIELTGRRMIAQRPEERTGVYCFIFETQPGTLMKFYSYIKRSDTTEISYVQFSKDGGITWDNPRTIVTGTKTEEGTERYYFRNSIVHENRLLSMKIKGVLPTDDPLEGLKHWSTWYTVSEDGGRTNIVEEQVILNGAEYDDEHPVPGVWKGRNSLMMGDRTELPIITKYQQNQKDNGVILLPVQITPVGEDGSYYNPGGGYTYHYSAVIRGIMKSDGHVEWIDMSEPVNNEPGQSTRGAIEPTIIELKDGRILMVMRGSNGGSLDPEFRIPSYRWYCVSEDGGRSFCKPHPWGYTDGEVFFSPSSCSQLLEHSNGRYYWIGNINRENSRANMPRNPLYIVEVDRDSLLLIKETACIVADVEEGQSPDTTFSNFYAREERGTGDILVYMTAFHADPDNIFGADAYEYRLRIGES
ncbi:MAG TPA: sialidase family protein [Clostridia bacterium]|nr:sialidase family protein [Clostridia bacterium]HPQ47007.1 sialidase family protein [Clostridia bacterium]HRX41781.1 sialidase family protein [Clostridia bacterium]